MYLIPDIHGWIQDIAKPLTRMMEENWTAPCSPEGEVVFWSLKESMCTAPVLGYL
jgi:hypothetical protein